MFHFTNVKKVFDLITNSYLDAQDDVENPIDKLNLFMNISGSVIDSVNEYQKPPKKDTIKIASFPDKEPNLFIQASSSKEDVVDYLRSKSICDKEFSFELVYPSVMLFNKEGSSVKTLIDTKNSDK